MRLSLRARLSTWWKAMRYRSDFEQAMDEELRFHLASHAADLVARGMSPEDAERRARLAMGISHAATQERCRESYGLRLWDDLVADLRYALRQFRHAPGFTATVVIVLALGIGANAAMFTVIGATLLRRLPFGQADKIVELVGADKFGQTLDWTGDSDILGWQKAKSLAELLYYRDGVAWVGRGQLLENVNHPVVGVNFCEFLRVTPKIGRCFASSDSNGAEGHVVLLSDALWRSLLHADASVVGSTITLDQQPYTIIGVMAPTFQFPLNPKTPQLWSPLELMGTRPPTETNSRTFEALARLAQSVTLDQAQAELSAVQHSLAVQRAKQTSLNIAQVQVLVRDYRRTLSGGVRPALLALTAAVAILWLIACVNVANLLLARGVGRQREIAIRIALGAGRWRIVRQLLLEALLLSLAGCAVGIFLAEGALLGFARLLQRRLHMSSHPIPDLRVMSALLLLTLLSSLAFGLVPALIASRADPEHSLRQQTSALFGRGHLRLQHGLVACEVACTVVLLVACGLLLRTVFALRSVPLGFRTDHVALVHPEFPGYKYDKADMAQTLYDPLLERIRAIHGVESAALTTVAPLSKGFGMQLAISFGETDTGPETHRVAMHLHADSRDLQKVLGFGMHQGRFFDHGDTRTTQSVAVVNQSFVRLWKASGKRLDEIPLSLDRAGKRKLRIVGVMDDVRQISVAEAASPELDLCADQLLPTDNFYQPVMAAYAEIAIRTSVPIETITPDIRSAMAQVDPSLQGSVVETMQEVVNTNIGDQLFAARLLEAFGACALLVALTGLYGFLAYFVSQRTHEIGVRVALGAQRARIQWMFLGRALAMLGAGLASGLCLSLLATRLVSRFLFGVRPNDLLTLGGVALLMLGTGLVAAWLPARRASHIQPMEALREA